jgi:hypothetical protein
VRHPYLPPCSLKLPRSRSLKAANEEGEGTPAQQVLHLFGKMIDLLVLSLRQNALCRSIIRKEFLLIASQSQRIVKQEMKILTEPAITSENAIPKVTSPLCVPLIALQATLGLVILSSTSLAMKRDSLTSSLRMSPYSEVMYNFHSKHEQILVLEQVYASRCLSSMLCSAGPD